MDLSEIIIWLQENTSLGTLPNPVLNAISQVVEERVFFENYSLVVEDNAVDGLYILKEGKLESSSDNPAKTSLCCGVLPGTVINLQELLLNQTAQSSFTTLTESHFFFVSAEDFKQLANKYPEISREFSRQLVEEVADLESALNYQQERSLALRPYIVGKAKRGIVGSSRYAIRLRQEIKEAANHRKSVLIFGEPGLEKDNIAALIHFSSPLRREPIIKINCGILQTTGADLFGRVGGKTGLLEWLGSGTLILNNIQELPQELLPNVVNLLLTNIYTPVSRLAEANPKKLVSKARIIIVAEKTQSAIDRTVGMTIKVPPLRVRKSDIKSQADFYISLYTLARGIPKRQVSPEALRRLQSYDFPGNLKELESLVERSIVQAGEVKELTEEIFWPAQSKKKQFRVNLLNLYPKLRKFLRSPWWTDRINYYFTAPVFAFILAVLFLGPQTRDKNVVLNLFWDWWWAGFLFLFPFLGRVWCSVCPFMIYGEITQKISLKFFPRQLKKWPRQQADKWGGWFLFGFFTLIFLWEELWHLENTAYLSACLLLLITSGAMIFSAIFERRFWCRYLCPIGGMNGLFAKLAMTELRAQQGICSASCNTYQCYKGGPQKGEGMESDGCPLYSHPAQLEDNRDCVLCMTCLKACPHRSVEFNLRPPGIELWTTHVAHSYEVALLFLLLGGVYLHRLPEIESWLGLQIDLNQFFPHLGFSLLALILPVSLPIVAYALIKLVNKGRKSRPFIELAYGYLPLVLGSNLAHYLRLALGEGGKVLPVTFATFGLNGMELPAIVAHPAVISFLQGFILIFSVICSVILTQKIARQSMRSLMGQHLTIFGNGFILWQIIINTSP
jgi:transcriptional regulator with AAA-type ATPase domain/NAD-dependent dihydropyrimidine dehydrogenase PreA subunit